MKKLYHVIAIIAVATLGLFAVSSCSKTSHSIWGYWLYQDGELKNILYFGDEPACLGRYKGYETLEDSSGPLDKQLFTYEYTPDLNELLRYYGDSDEYSRYNDVKLVGSKLTLSSRYGDFPTTTYQRYHPKKK